MRRLPPLLWVRLRRDLGEFLQEVGSDGQLLYRWGHSHFQKYVEEAFLKRPAGVFPSCSYFSLFLQLYNAIAVILCGSALVGYFNVWP